MKHEGFTPGPWQVVSIGTMVHVSQETDEEGRFSLASVAFPTYHPDGLAAADREQKSNARLIADAPALLARVERLEALLRDLMADFKGSTDFSDTTVRGATIGAIRIALIGDEK